MRVFVTLLLGVLLGLAGGFFLWGASQPHTDVDTVRPARVEQAAIVETLRRQSEAWNRGDIEAFMEDYFQSPTLRFASGGGVTTGWQETLDRYKARYDDRAKMGVLAFTDIEVTPLSGTDALVFGRWALEREKDRPSGLFTLHMRREGERWIIVSDHTSSAQ